MRLRRGRGEWSREEKRAKGGRKEEKGGKRGEEGGGKSRREKVEGNMGVNGDMIKFLIRT